MRAFERASTLAFTSGVGMSVYEIDPLKDPRWPEFLQTNLRASVFHTPGWLETLKRTYEYEPMAYTTSPPKAPLENAWVFCRIRSWLTGRRLVSLPFSDHCDPLVESGDRLQELSETLRREREANRWNYIEYRPRSAGNMAQGFDVCETFWLHELNLQRTLDDIFRGLHKDSTQRKIKRARREGLTCELGCSERFLDRFYELLVSTRRRHHVPPQPRSWFSNLMRCMGNQMKIWIAARQGLPVAGIVTLQFKRTLVYKYGGADQRFFNLGGMQMLLWRAIQEANRDCLASFDLGRSSPENEGLLVFKDRLGAVRKEISYFRNPEPKAHHRITRRAIASHIPNALLIPGGRLLYRHFG
jgi:Acetyltransferase (GNAT) domain